MILIYIHTCFVCSTATASSSYQKQGKSICFGIQRSQVQPEVTKALNCFQFPCVCGGGLCIATLEKSHLRGGDKTDPCPSHAVAGAVLGRERCLLLSYVFQGLLHLYGASFGRD